MDTLHAKILALSFIIATVGTAGAAEKVQPLGSLIGKWACKTESAAFESEFRWTLDRTFIEHDQQVHIFGKSHRVKEIIGWDPESKSIKGWIFSRAWIATSTYSPAEEEGSWIVEVILTRKDGTKNRKRKTLTVADDKMIVTTDKAPVKDFLTLEFKRLPVDEGEAP